MKILIIGFPRSGTSLTYRIFKDHRDVGKAHFESLLAWKHRDKQLDKLQFFGEKNVCEKIIYERKYISAKENFTYLDYCNLWNKTFKNQSKIIQILRHPYDSWNSIIIEKYMKRKIEKSICRMLKNYFNSIPTNIEKIDSYPNSLTFKFEHLVEDPEYVLNKIYTHCELDPKRSLFNETIRSKKSFLYKTKDFSIENKLLIPYRAEFWDIMNRNIDGLLQVMNQFEGPIYEK